MMKKMDSKSGARMAQEVANRATEVAERVTPHATTSKDRAWLEDIANAIRALSPATNTASVEKMREDLAQAVQTNRDFLLTASRELGRRTAFLQQLQALQLFIDQQFRANSARIAAPSTEERPKDEPKAELPRLRPQRRGDAVGRPRKAKAGARSERRALPQTGSS